ncbi:MAG TPA: transglycosylase SLT domain-containing protein [Thermoleophilaceae bacterium]
MAGSQIAIRGGRVKALLGVLALVGLAIGLAVALSGGKGKLVPGAGNRSGTYDPLAYTPARAAEFERNAAAGESHVVYAKSPGGVIATARRTARYRGVIERLAAPAGIDPNVLEGIVFLESAGRPDVIAGSDPANASGLTQILAETGSNLLGMHVNLAASRRLTKKIARAKTAKRVRRLEAARRRVDARFDPAKAIAATIRYLQIAKRALGRDDLAVTSYHMGIGNLQTVLRDYSPGSKPRDLSYVQVYFDSSPLRHRAAYNLLSRFGDDSSNYYWKVLAAEQIMRMYRTNLPRLERISALQNARASAEEVLHPEGSTTQYANPAEIARDAATGRLVPLPNDPKRYAFRVDPLLGQFAGRLHRRRALYMHLRPEALGLLIYMALGTRAIGAPSTPLLVTSAVRDERYQHLVAAANIEATHGYSLHTTGFTFDIRRAYSSHREALAFQFMLDRLQAMNLIAWVREPEAIHVTVSSAARVLHPLVPGRG